MILIVVCEGSGDMKRVSPGAGDEVLWRGDTKAEWSSEWERSMCMYLILDSYRLTFQDFISIKCLELSFNVFFPIFSNTFTSAGVCLHSLLKTMLKCSAIYACDVFLKNFQDF